MKKGYGNCLQSSKTRGRGLPSGSRRAFRRKSATTEVGPAVNHREFAGEGRRTKKKKKKKNGGGGRRFGEGGSEVGQGYRRKKMIMFM